MAKLWVTLILGFSILPVIGSQLSNYRDGTYNSSCLDTSQVVNNVFSYEFPNENDLVNLFPMAPCQDLTLEEASIEMLQEYMSQGRLTSVQIVMCYIQRAFQVDEYVK